jgi:hypothetical protein
MIPGAPTEYGLSNCSRASRWNPASVKTCTARFSAPSKDTYDYPRYTEKMLNHLRRCAELRGPIPYKEFENWAPMIFANPRWHRVAQL